MKKSPCPATIVAIILGMLVLPVFPQNTRNTSEVSDKIADLLIKAAGGDADAQSSLGGYYASEFWGVTDYKEAVRWLRAASEQGHAAAQVNLGGMYRSGTGVPRDYKEAVRWFREAAEQGEEVEQAVAGGAQVHLGMMYEDGQGVPQDFIQAQMWYNLAASNLPGHREEIIKMRDLVAEKMTYEQIAEAQLVSKVPLRNFRGAWSEAQVREWASGPVKEWLDKTAVLFSMLKPQNWHHRNFPTLLDRDGQSLRSAQRVVSDAQANLDRLLAQPYSPAAAHGILRNLGYLEAYVEDFLVRVDDLTRGPSPELIREIISHSVSGTTFSEEFAEHVAALINWYEAAVMSPRW